MTLRMCVCLCVCVCVCVVICRKIACKKAKYHSGKADWLYSGKSNTNQGWGFQNGRF